jgi:MiaB/RimO family radical SAM methylthiotransferase
VQEVRKTVRRLHRLNPKAELVVTGCSATVLVESQTKLPEAVRLMPQELKPALAFLSTGREGLARQDEARPLPEKSRFPELSISKYPRARPVLKVQDGCSRGCTYCIVPRTRGPASSRHPTAILAEAERLARKGYGEIVLSGINLAQYSKAHQGFRDFWDLVAWLDRRLAESFGDVLRLRLSSLDPAQLTDKALRVLADSRLICPHLHLAIQSGSPRVLHEMGRSASCPEGVPDFLAGLSAIWPLFGLGGDILIGFPGEGSKDFSQTLDVVQELPFSYAHVFPFSPRPGTPAASRPDQIPDAVKKERSRRVRRIVQENKNRFINRVVREIDRLDVVLEGSDPAHGLCELYLPCSFQPGAVPAGNGGVAPARPRHAIENGLLVEALNQP